jgi:hypothetical protein
MSFDDQGNAHLGAANQVALLNLDRVFPLAH